MPEDILKNKVVAGASENQWNIRSTSFIRFLESGEPFNKHIFWIIIDLCFAPFSWLILYIQFYDNSPAPENPTRTTHANNALPRCLVAGFFLLITMGIAIYPNISPLNLISITYSSTVAFLTYLVLCTFINLLTLNLMYFFSFSSLRRGVSDNHNLVCRLLSDHHTRITDSLKGTYERLDRILGHKVWAGKKTYEFLNELISSNLRFLDSKWLLVNFLAEVVEDTLESHSPYAVTAASWSECRYSKFLADNIIFAKEVWWCVDPNDFFYHLLPTYAGLVLASIGYNHYKYSFNLEPNIESNLGSIINNKIFTDNFVPGYKKDLIVSTRHDAPDLNLKEIRDKIYEPIANLGLKALKELEIEKEIYSLLNGDEHEINKLHEGYIYCFSDQQFSIHLPHIESFRIFRGSKRRVIYLGNLNIKKPIKATEYDYLLDAIKYYWNIQKFINAFRKMWNTDINPDKNNIHIIISGALELFSYTCGGPGICSVVTNSSIKNDLLGPQHDMGVYDNCIIVKSNPLNGDGNRKVTWSYYCSKGDEPEEVKYLFDESDTNLKSRSYIDFALALLGML